MSKSWFRKFWLILVLAVLLLPTALVAAKELSTLTISGPGIDGELTLDDPEEVGLLEQNGFLEQSQKTEAPQGLGEGYTIDVHLNMEDGPVPWMQMIYYPGPRGERGYIQMVGPLNEEAQVPVGVWYLAFPPAEEAFQKILAGHGVAVEAALAPPKSEPVEAAQAPADQPVKENPQPATVPEERIPSGSAADLQAAAPSSAPGLRLDPTLILGLVALVVLSAGLGFARWLSVQRRQGSVALKR